MAHAGATDGAALTPCGSWAGSSHAVLFAKGGMRNGNHPWLHGVSRTEDGEPGIARTENQNREDSERNPELEAEHGSYLAVHYTTKEASGCCHFAPSAPCFWSG